MAKVTYRGVVYDTDRDLVKEMAYVKSSKTYRGISYTSSDKVELVK